VRDGATAGRFVDALTAMELMVDSAHLAKLAAIPFSSGRALGDIMRSMASTATIRLSPLTKRSMTELVAKAKRMGIDPGDYARRLIEDGLALQREAEASSFAHIMRPVRKAAGEVQDTEIIKLVERARAEHHSNGPRKKG
jgi:hypothetical protein